MNAAIDFLLLEQLIVVAYNGHKVVLEIPLAIFVSLCTVVLGEQEVKKGIFPCYNLFTLESDYERIST